MMQPTKFFWLISLQLSPSSILKVAFDEPLRLFSLDSQQPDVPLMQLEPEHLQMLTEVSLPQDQQLP